MRKVFQFFTQKWLLSLIAILLLCLIVWFIGPLIAIADYKPLASDVVRLVVILVLLVAWGLNNLRVSKKENSQDDKISKEIAKNTKEVPVESKNPDEEILAKRFNEALKTLQSSKVGKKNKLYSLPWYLIIGQPGSGKTTALKNSGLQFPLHSKFGDAPIQGAGGTRYCDWWFTNQAILIDTAGRYTSQEDPQKMDSKSWMGFLNIIKKGRPKRPINGIIVTISISDILNKTNTQKSIHATALKQRIQEVNHQLSMELPVYVMVTKTDTIAGFTTFFDDMEKEDREQIFGFNFPNKKITKETDLKDHYQAEYDKLTESVNNRVLYLLDHQKSQNKRNLIHQFPHQMNALRPLLLEFLNNIFTPNQFETPLLIRGLYFVSSTQANMSSQWVSGGLPPEKLQNPIDQVSTEAKTYFVHNLLKNLIFKEANLATINSKSRHKFKWTFWALTGSTLGVFLATVFFWNNSVLLNDKYIEGLSGEVKEYTKITDGGLADTRNWLSLANGLDHLRELTTGYEKGSDDYPLAQGLGLYQGEKLGEEASRTYKKALASFLMVDIETMLSEQLNSYNSNDEQLYEALKFYLMLYNLDKMEQEVFLVWVDILLQREIPGENNALLREHLVNHVKTAIDEKISPPPINERLVTAAREQLIQTPIDLRLYRRLKNDYLKSNPGQYKLSDQLGKKGELIFYRASGRTLDDGIPKLFTYNGFHSVYNIQNKKLAERLTGEQWIYGDELPTELSDEQIEEITDQVDNYYFEDYRNHWQDLITDIRIKPFSSVNQGQAVLRLLASSQKPFIEVLLSIKKNTDLATVPGVSEEKKEAAGKLADSFADSEQRRLERLVPLTSLGPKIQLPGHEISEEFEELNEYIQTEEGLPLSQLQASIEQLNRHFSTLADAGNTNEAAFSASVNAGSGSDPIRILKRSVREAHPDIRLWFNEVAENAGTATVVATKEHLNNLWQSDVLSFYNKAIKGRYPVNPASKQDIKLSDFARFFGPSGILQNYFNNNLSSFVDKSRSRWKWKDNTGISNSRLKVFQQADAIQKAFFGEGDSAAGVSFLLKPLSLDKLAGGIVLNTGGQSLTYKHGPPRTQALKWPEDTTANSKITFTLVSKGTPVSVRTEGDWAWFRLLDQYAEITPVEGTDSFNLELEVKGITAEFLLSPESTFNPFTTNVVKNFSIPKKL